MAIYSPADRLQPHRYKANEAYLVGTPEMPPVSCYLDTDHIIRIAKEADVDAIHPGYGFLAENADFAKKCAAAGIAFVGPLPETIEVRMYAQVEKLCFAKNRGTLVALELP